MKPGKILPTIIRPDPPSPSPMNPRWQCVFCDEPAVLMHKGSTYCRRDYNEKNIQGGLVN